MIAMDKARRTRRSGPRTFDRDEAVATAMRLFWRHGYEGVSISDLTTAIGIAPPSLYAAFGSKAELYREALDRYGELPRALNTLVPLETPSATAAALLRRAIEFATDPQGEGGCMISLGMVQCGPDHAIIARDLAARRQAMVEAAADVFSRWLDAASSRALARYLLTVMQGIAIQTRDGVGRQELLAMADTIVDDIRRRYDAAAGRMAEPETA
ncbi:AcrR family transcriptional regulator [Azospirillum picis]|nr:AcrR family transcriptional regulator [Azospirillum picis]